MCALALQNASLPAPRTRMLGPTCPSLPNPAPPGAAKDLRVVCTLSSGAASYTLHSDTAAGIVFEKGVQDDSEPAGLERAACLCLKAASSSPACSAAWARAFLRTRPSHKHAAPPPPTHPNTHRQRCNG